jgi:hypothetical protein
MDLLEYKLLTHMVVVLIPKVDTIVEWALVQALTIAIRHGDLHAAEVHLHGIGWYQTSL